MDKRAIQMYYNSQLNSIELALAEIDLCKEISSYDSALALPGEIDTIYNSLQKLYKEIYNKKFK